MEEEVLRYIPGYEGEYLISNLGNVYSESKPYRNQHGACSRWRPRKKMSFIYCQSGYYEVTLKSKGKSEMFLVHRLVAQSFVPNPNNYPEVNHIDGNRLNNVFSNLEWTTRRGNLSHAKRHDPRALSRFFGVGYRNKKDKYYARVSVKGKRFYLGSFSSEIDAAKAYDAFILKNKLEDEYPLNFPKKN